MSHALIHQPLIDRTDANLGRLAVQWRGGSLTHGELRAHVLTFAGRLRESGVAEGDRVVVALPKRAEAVVAILGTLTAGAIYVPLDMSTRPQRIADILVDADPAAIVTDATSAVAVDWSRGSDHVAVMTPPDLSAGAGLAHRTGAAAPQLPGNVPSIDVNRPAAILYTSGSTGDPKGIVLSHGNISSFVRWAIDQFDLARDDRFCSHARFHFDLSTLDLFAPIALGACVYLLDEAVVRFPAAITRTIEMERLTVWYATPSALQLVADHGGLDRRDLSSLRWVLFAGEVFPVPALRRLMERLPGPRYANLYGPTETNVCTFHLVNTPPDPGGAPLPIGVAREDLELAIFDDEGQARATGEIGEICVTGPAVMLGYWRQPDLTAATRLPGRDDSYRTGDLGRIDTEGLLHFLGRRDHQVKVQGHRLELLEVERYLASHPHVAGAAVVPVGEPGETRLLAFVAAREGEQLDPAALRRHCAESLPTWAVPDRFTFLPELPLTTTGKVDRQRLTRIARDETIPPPTR